MKELFKIKEISFYAEDFLDDLSEYEDIIPIIKELEPKLHYEKIAVTEKNECCGKSKDNYFIQIHGYINKDDEFITKEELDMFNNTLKKEDLDLFVIRVYKCVDCGKWIIDILE
ncbi:hypothetical protein NNC19_05130 [Clostridium sp. SHJSY1]|uniref:hypothetical protein n=1 Tax=Clostridium sp. SHJSY1 TaxID=2942483 RepID=UPI0028768DBE|nr:hypothetical protein [Clostridium sp. SHJSY1]MDS0525056.1 hypothetical protein [Clostridium sp. SHJSY1]